MNEVVECPMKYIACRWNCWSDGEGAWFRIYESGRFEKGKKYTVLLPTDISRGLDSRFFKEAFNATNLNPDDFCFPNYKKQFNEYKKEYSDNPFCSWNTKRHYGHIDCEIN